MRTLWTLLRAWDEGVYGQDQEYEGCVTLDLENGLDRLHRCIVHDARDWSLTKRDAITYALVVG